MARARAGGVLPPGDAEGQEEAYNLARRGDATDIVAAVEAVARGGTWGRIVGLTSGGQHGFPEEVSYGAAKAAQENYTMSASVELAAYGVTANIVYPPVTDTGWVTDEVRAAVEASRELSHVATSEEVADVMA